jgi:hypothetical protein
MTHADLLAVLECKLALFGVRYERRDLQDFVTIVRPRISEATSGNEESLA